MRKNLNTATSAQTPALSIFDQSDSYFEKQALGYLEKFLDKIEPASIAARKICLAIEGNYNIPGFPSRKKPNAEDLYYTPTLSKAVSQSDWTTVKAFFSQRKNDLSEGEPDTLNKNLQRLSDILTFGDTEKQVVNLLHVLEREPKIAYLISIVTNESTKAPLAIGIMLDRMQELQKITSFMTPTGQLHKYSLIKLEGENSAFPVFEPSVQVKLSQDGLSDGEVVGDLIGKLKTTNLTLDDFGYLGDKLKTVTQMANKAADLGQKGVNILVCGPWGAGKNEVVAAIAAANGKKLYSIGEEDSGNDLPNNEDRIAQLMRAGALLENSRDTYLMFDEIEDLEIKGTDNKTRSSNTESKIQLNRLLENAPVVTFCLGNHPEEFDPAFLRRFTHVLRLGIQPTLARKNIWERQLSLQNTSLPEADVLDLARKYQTPASMIADAVRVMVLSDGGREVLEEALREKAAVVLGHRDSILAPMKLPQNFSPKFVNIVEETSDIEALAVRHAGHKPFSLAVHEAPNAGAENLLHYLGERMTMNVMEFSADELLSIDAQGTPEQKVRAIFQMAADEHAFLILKDAHKLEREKPLPRAFAQAARAHDLPYAIILPREKKLSEPMDCLFSEHCMLDPMTEAQSASAYEAYFGRKAPENLGQLKNLTADIFDHTRNMLRFQTANDDSAVLAAIKRQQDALKMVPTVGFRPS